MDPVDLYDTDQHDKPDTDTKAKPPWGRVRIYPIPIKITTVVGEQDGEGNDLYDVVELDGKGVSLGIAHTDVPNVGRPAATLEVDHQTDMGRSAESGSFFFSEAV